MFAKNLDTYWKTVFNTIQDGLMIIDKAGSIVSVNRALESITGYGRDELIGKTCAILNCDICDKARSKDVRGDHWCILFRTGKVHKKKCTFERKDGTYVHALKNATLLHDNTGKILGAVESVTDLTEIIEKDNQIAAFRREMKLENGFHGLLGASANMKQTFDLIENASQSSAPIIIYGESGTGKELVAESIHRIGERREKPFVKINCAALTESLLESELFGHVKGAYTGAYKGRSGRFEMASGGDIFLDEIGDLPLSTQVKLLRVLEQKVIERVGDSRPIPVDVRIISATNRNLPDLVEKGRFREDLYFRINVIPINIPPLRERAEDISILAESFFQRNRLKTGKKIKGINKEVMGILINYKWPGNVRELKSVFEYAFVTCNESMIQAEHLPPNIIQGVKQFHVTAANIMPHRDEILKRSLMEALELANGNQSKAAKILNVSRVTIWNRMKKFNINFHKQMDA
ncbi:MAG: PAS domain S-box protein [Deltaproteobacteria bacterium]|nr:PAS domain S-box protein [Deltaproteobacteria bacterium]